MASTSVLSSAPTSPNSKEPGDGASGPSAEKPHIRTYQACIPCRKRKVKCDLGPVDNPHDPPCSRCRRESKECFFSSTRRKRKPGETGDDDEDAEPDEYELRNGRKSLRSGSSDQNWTDGNSRPTIARPDSAGYAHVPLTPGGSAGNPRPLPRPGSQPLYSSSDGEDEAIKNETTSKFQKSEILHPMDAMDLMREIPVANSHREGSVTAGTAEQEAASSLSAMRTRLPTAPRRASNKPNHPTFDPSKASDRPTRVVDFDDPDPAVQDAIRAWSRVRFVKAGWFSPVEGIDYIEYFYEHLSPLTPVAIPDFRDPAQHGKLLAEEPILAITLLTISSRYCTPRGRGAITRAYTNHDELWRHLQQNLNRVVWAQEKFGRGAPKSEMKDSEGGKAVGHSTLRSVGTIESLILLTEWHCRSLHFPTSDDNNILIDPPKSVNLESSWRDRGQNINSWLEPSWRSERMCWSLLSIAMALAFELRIFDKEDTPLQNEEDAQAHRIENVKRLLFVFITQTSGRLSLKSMLPDLDQYSQFPVDPVDFTEHALSARNQSPHNISSEIVHQVVLYFWYELTKFMKDGNKDAFPSRTHTRELIRSGQYVEVLTTLNSRLAQLRKKFDDCAIIPERMRLVLKIEFEYNRVYSNSLALHAVVERCRNDGEAGSNGPNGTIPPEVLLQWFGHDRPFIDEIIQAANSVLHCVGHVLGRRNLLKFAPVRTFFRIISVSMVLLKCFACGLPAEDAAQTFGLLNRTAEALGTSVVDDVHVGSQMGEVLQKLTQCVRSSAIRVGRNKESEGARTQAGRRSGNEAASALLPDLAHSSHRKLRPGTNGKVNAQFPPTSMEFSTQSDTSRTQVKSETSPSSSHQAGFQNSYNSVQHQSPYAASPSIFMSAQTPRSIDSFGTEDPLRGINQYEYDPSNPSVSLIPPTSFMSRGQFSGGGIGGVSQTSDQNATSGSDNFDAASFDWVGLPLEPIMRNIGADPFQAGFGPQFGDQDMLDFYSTDFLGNNQNFYSN